ncbi:DEAD/DEAH box helicase [Demequina zhanjiangensis]|uniref:DEAD/DEAH box helicase n=1 Tax=Demequina zhanjiangensis TaxID=3051659 RepID=A0ABT8G3K2_9MICO|nr:DEAD/DEAH box helicase [Demequina sp. SYSU T00b26]MDN4473732.1 DEAD/DEAH box helicase [Demequina sp. SYSU T00b26]
MPIHFADLGVPTQLTTVLEREGKLTPFPIQADTLPDTLAGRDVLGRGKTGSGKTLAFSLPVAARLGAKGGKARPGRPRALILAPTRELATQIDAVIAPLAAAYGMNTTTIFGGVNQRRQENAMARGADIVVACPGRLEDLMKQGIVSLDSVEITVLDEADHMADLGFLPGVTRIMNATPQRGQRLLFSATLDNGVDKLVKRFLDNPITHSVDSADSHVDAMTHHVFHVNGADGKKDVVRALASGTGRRILFMRTKHQAKKLAKQLTAEGIPSVDLHGNLAQGARDRNLAAFAEGRAKVLVATDVAARGVHVDGIELVVHVDPPMEHKAYLHRSGRTARAGTSGDVVTLVLPEQRRDTQQLLRKANIKAEPQAVNATSPQVVTLIGEVAPYVKPAPVEDKPQGGRGRGRGRGAQGAGGQGGNGRSGGQGGSRGNGGGRGPRRDDAQGQSRGGRGQQQGSRRGQNRDRAGADQSQGHAPQGRGRSSAGGQGQSRRSGGHSSAAAFSAGGGGNRRRSR